MANRIKIKVIDNKSNFRLRLPSIPFWIIITLVNFAFLFKPVFLKYAGDLDEDAKFILKELDSKSVNELFNTLRSCGRFDLVDISTGDGTEVKISIL